MEEREIKRKHVFKEDKKDAVSRNELIKVRLTKN